jgi:hypothetical protein
MRWLLAVFWFCRSSVRPPGLILHCVICCDVSSCRVLPFCSSSSWCVLACFSSSPVVRPFPQFCDLHDVLHRPYVWPVWSVYLAYFSIPLFCFFFFFFFFFFFSSGPRAYAPDALQPIGLLCYPSVLDVPAFAASPSPRPCYPRDP